MYIYHFTNTLKTSYKTYLRASAQKHFLRFITKYQFSLIPSSFFSQEASIQTQKNTSHCFFIRQTNKKIRASGINFPSADTCKK